MIRLLEIRPLVAGLALCLSPWTFRAGALPAPLTPIRLSPAGPERAPVWSP